MRLPTAVCIAVLLVACSNNGFKPYNPLVDFGGTGDGGASADLSFVDADLDTCASLVACLDWPLAGDDGAQWVINNYIDHDASSGLRDYTGASGDAAKTYDQHNGLDIDISSFRQMDLGTPVHAAAPGVVTKAVDGFPDRHTSCINQDANYVVLRHASGETTLYTHLKTGSVAVAVGQTVTRGATLGMVGSSGCSTGPHLHFEVRTASGALVDPIIAGYFRSPPAYDRALSFLDANLHSGALAGVESVKDPAPNITQLVAGNTLGVGLSLAGGHTGDTVLVRYTPPTGTPLESSTMLPPNSRHTYWYFDRTLPSTTGNWTITVHLNGTQVASYPLLVQ